MPYYAIKIKDVKAGHCYISHEKQGRALVKAFADSVKYVCDVEDKGYIMRIWLGNIIYQSDFWQLTKDLFFFATDSYPRERLLSVDVDRIMKHILDLCMVQVEYEGRFLGTGRLRAEYDEDFNRLFDYLRKIIRNRSAV
jgi:hypothetical protein